MTGHGLLVVAVWVVAAGSSIWILGPVVGFLLGRRRLEVDVHPESLIARPYPEDADGVRRYEQFVALGFRPVGWTSEHARFLTPLHWRWRSLQGTRWLASPDRRTFACIYRVVAKEPARFGAVTLFEGDGSWQTYYPGAGLKQEVFGNHGRAEVRGVEPAELLARHAEYVETFGRERGLAVKPGTLAEVADASVTYSRAYLTKQGGAAFLALPLGMFALPAAFCFPTLARGTETVRLAGALGVIGMALFYALFRYGLLTLTKGLAARHMHTREFELEQTAVASDGSIAPGRYERWVRVVAMVGVADMLGRLVFLASKGPAILRLGSGTIFLAAVMALAVVSTLRVFIRRIQGRAARFGGKHQVPTGIWPTWAFLGLWMNSMSKNEFRPSHLVWLGGVFAFAMLGWSLEKHGRK